MSETRKAETIEPRIVLDAHRLLDDAIRIADEGDVVAANAERFRLYYLAALRTAGAALVVLESRRRGPRGQRSAWVRLAAQARAQGADDLARAVDFFGGFSVLRQRIETGLVHDVDQAAVARMRVRLAEFIGVAEDVLGDYEQGRPLLASLVEQESA